MTCTFLPANSMLVEAIMYVTLLLPLENIVFAAYLILLPGVLYSIPVSLIAFLFLSSVINHNFWINFQSESELYVTLTYEYVIRFMLCSSFHITKSKHVFFINISYARSTFFYFICTPPWLCISVLHFLCSLILRIISQNTVFGWR